MEVSVSECHYDVRLVAWVRPDNRRVPWAGASDGPASPIDRPVRSTGQSDRPARPIGRL